MIAVIITFRKSNKNSLKRRAGADRSSRKKRHILLNPEINVIIFHAAYFYFIFNQFWQETSIQSRSMRTFSADGVLGQLETVVLTAGAAASFQSAAICMLYHILSDTAYIMNNQTLSNPPPLANDSAKRNIKTQKRKSKV